MTRMSASVANGAEADLALRLGADVVAVRPAGDGDAAGVVAAVAAAVAGRGETWATLGDPPDDPAKLGEAARRFAAAGASVIEVAADAQAIERCGAAFAEIAGTIRLAAAMLADEAPDFDLLPKLRALGFAGAVLDTGRKASGRLIDHLGVAELERFCADCRAEGLTSGLSGSLEAPDTPRLLLVRPDMLRFGAALRRGHDPKAALDPRRIALIRDLIPRENADADDARWTVDPNGAVDCVFVRDFVVQASIGAYDFERNATQRVAFDVEASVVRTVARADDLREIFSYDVMLDAIRLAVGRGHIRFIETLAEEVAAATLLHPRVRSVRVNVRKLDVIDGAVGIEIRRERARSDG